MSAYRKCLDLHTGNALRFEGVLNPCLVQVEICKAQEEVPLTQIGH